MSSITPISPRLSILSRLGLAFVVVLAFPIALFALRYLLADPPAAPLVVLSNRFATPFLPVHAAAGAMALAIGWVQFLPRFRAAHTRLHRLIGSGYVLACAASGSAGLILAWGTSSGWGATAGFGGLGLGLLTTTAMGLARALAGRFDSHRRWMIRSYALTFSAVTLRLQLLVTSQLGVDFHVSYPLISFACWIPNLILAELLITGAARPAQNQPASRKAG